MANITTNTLKIGDNNLVLRDADAQARITTLEADTSTLKDDMSQVIDSAYVTDTASGAIASFPDGADNMPVKSLTVAIEPVQSGSGDPSPDNVRPISGWTQAVVTRSGVNLWDEEVESGYINPVNGNPVADSGKIRMKNFMPVQPNTTYYKKSPVSFWNVYYDANKNYIGYGGSEANQTFTTPNNCYYIRFGFETAYGTTYNHDISINYPSTDHDYHEGHVQTVTVDLGQTVYGGTLDVGTGVLTVDRAIVTFDGSDDEHWEKVAYGSASGFAMATPLVHKFVNSNDNLVVNFLKSIPASVTWGNEDNWITSQNNGGIITGIKAITTLNDWKACLASNNLDVCYELDESFAVTLTQTEVRTLLGTNNIWSDAGTVDVEYRADTKRYIEKLTAPTEDDMIADHAISANSFFMIGNTLYRATTAIASGATITVGTNATKLSLSDALNALA